MKKLFAAFLLIAAALVSGPATAQQFGGSFIQLVPDRTAETDYGVITGVANTAQVVIPANIGRRVVRIQNQGINSATAPATNNNCWIRGDPTPGTPAATADFHSLRIPAGGYYENSALHVSNLEISIICDAANVPVYIRSR